MLPVARMAQLMTDPRLPADPGSAGFAWARFRRLMGFMVLLTLGVVAIALWLFYREFGLVSIHLYIATGLGVFFAMMLTAVLMGLAFVSNASGHDSAIGSGEDQPGGGESR
jgi:magnesium-transporting ATPase (P-type)